MDLSREKNVGEGGIAWNEDRKALTRIGVEFNYGEVGNELWLTVELVWWYAPRSGWRKGWERKLVGW